MGNLIVLTGLWKAKTKDGKTYLKGRINNVDVIILPTSEKKKDNSPDYNLCLAPHEAQKPPEDDSGLPF